jgi:phycoerythrin-associated linker protein
MSLWVENTDRVELRANASEDDLQVVIRSVYRQVLGNAHLLESDRLISAESFLRNGDITVRQFIAAVGQSELYQRKFFESSSQYRFIELNFKHFLGRAPQSQAEIADHVRIYNEQGYSAEIDSYLDSDEYASSFGDSTVPYARGTQSQVGQKNVTFNRSFALMRGTATSDASNKARLISALAGNSATKISGPRSGSGSPSSLGKRFRIQVATPGSGSRYRQANVTYDVNYSQLTNQVQSIQRRGGRILSVTEV